MKKAVLISIVAVFIVALVVPIVLLAAGGEKEGEFVIYVSYPNLRFPFFVFISEQIEDEGNKLGVVVHHLDGENTADKQTADIKSAIVQEPDAIIIDPLDVNALYPAVEEAVASDIPVATLDRRVEGVDAIFHVGVDNVKGGEKEAIWLIKQYPDGCRVVNLQGQPGTSPAIDRNKGLHNILDLYPDQYPIVVEQTANWAIDQGYNVTKQIFAGLDYVPEVIASANDEMAIGALQALEELGIADDVLIIGYDAHPFALRSIRDGGMDCTIEQFVGAQGRTVLQLMVDYLRTGREPADVWFEPISIDRTNLGQAERIALIDVEE